MPYLFEYILKLSVSFCAVYLFYQLFLRRLTFYNWNRWYLISYSLLSFLIPFLNLNLFVEPQQLEEVAIVRDIPVLNNFTPSATVAVQQAAQWDTWSILSLIIITGMGILFCRLLIQYLSFRQLKRKAQLLDDGNVKLYHLEEDIAPFSFGNAIYINANNHTEREMQEIMRHEFVHVKQRHSIDILLGELLCILNWFNPVVWLIRHDIRQNLEFIADNKVLEKGMDKKQYQYLLLKVIGNTQFSITTNFNFSSLKKRIVMMNKLRTAKIHLIKFLFILPLMAVLLLAFRNKMKTSENEVTYAAILYDVNDYTTLSNVQLTDNSTGKEYTTNEKGYFAIPVKLDDKNVLHISLQIKKERYKNWYRAFQRTYNSSKKNNITEMIGLTKGIASETCYTCLASMNESDKTGDGLYEDASISFKYYVAAKKSQLAKSKSGTDRDTLHGLPLIKDLKITSTAEEYSANDIMEIEGQVSVTFNADAKGLIIYEGKKYSANQFNSHFDSSIKFNKVTRYGQKAGYKNFGEEGRYGVIVIDDKKNIPNDAFQTGKNDLAEIKNADTLKDKKSTVWEFSKLQGVTVKASNCKGISSDNIIEIKGIVSIKVAKNAQGLVIYEGEKFDINQFNYRFDSSARFNKVTIYEKKAAYDNYGEDGKYGVLVINDKKDLKLDKEHGIQIISDTIKFEAANKGEQFKFLPKNKQQSYPPKTNKESFSIVKRIQKLHPDIVAFGTSFDSLTGRLTELVINFKNGRTEKYNLLNPVELSKATAKYGELTLINFETPYEKDLDINSLPADYKAFLLRNPAVRSVFWRQQPYPRIIVEKKNWKGFESYNLQNPADISRAESKYGKLPAQPAS